MWFWFDESGSAWRCSAWYFTGLTSLPCEWQGDLAILWINSFNGLGLHHIKWRRNHSVFGWRTEAWVCCFSRILHTLLKGLGNRSSCSNSFSAISKAILIRGAHYPDNIVSSFFFLLVDFSVYALYKVDIDRCLRSTWPPANWAWCSTSQRNRWAQVHDWGYIALILMLN